MLTHIIIIGTSISYTYLNGFFLLARTSRKNTINSRKKNDISVNVLFNGR